MRPFATLLLLILSLLPGRAYAQAAGTQLTVEGIISMVQAGVSDEIVISKSQKAGQGFDLSPEQIISLKKSKVSDAVIKALLDPKVTPTAPPETSRPSAPPPLAETTPFPEVGVYFKKAVNGPNSCPRSSTGDAYIQVVEVPGNSDRQHVLGASYGASS